MFRVKQESEVSDNDATYLDYRKHVSILSQISNERPTDDRHAFQRVGQFFELRHHPYFFAVAPKIIKANFLEESEIFSQNFDRLLLCLWQYSILGDFPQQSFKLFLNKLKVYCDPIENVACKIACCLNYAI